MHLLTRDVPDDLHHEAKKAALERKMTLNAFVIEAIKQAVGNKGRK